MKFKDGILGGSNIILPCTGGTLSKTISFTTPITKVNACVLKGFNIGFTEGDNKFRRATIVLKAAINGQDNKKVDVSAKVELRDQDTSGDIITGTVYFTLIVE